MSKFLHDKSTWSLCKPDEWQPRPWQLQGRWSDLDSEIKMNDVLAQAWRWAAKESPDRCVIAKFAFTWDNDLYKQVNSQIRDGYKSNRFVGFDYKNFVEILMGQIETVGHYMTLYRGLSDYNQALDHKNNIVLADQFLHCTDDRAMALAGMKSGTLFVIKSKVFINLNNSPFLASRCEYLIPPGVHFEIVTTRKKDGYREIELMMDKFTQDIPPNLSGPVHHSSVQGPPVATQGPYPAPFPTAATPQPGYSYAPPPIPGNPYPPPGPAYPPAQAYGSAQSYSTTHTIESNFPLMQPTTHSYQTVHHHQQRPQTKEELELTKHMFDSTFGQGGLMERRLNLFKKP